MSRSDCCACWHRACPRIHAVETVPAAVAAFENLHVHPGLLAGGPLKATTRRLPMPALTWLGTACAKRLHHGVGELIAGAEARDHRRRKYRVGERALRRHDGDRTGQPAVLRDVAVDDAVEQDRAQRQPDGAIDRTFDGMLIGRSGICGEVPVRSTVSSSPRP